MKREDKKKIIEYVYTNLATTLWSIFLLVGGAVFVIYYFSIHYMPDLDLKSSVTIVATSSITALFLTISLMLLFIAPGVIWGQTIDSNSKLKDLWHDGDKKKLSVLWWFGGSIFFVYLLLISFLTFPSFWLLSSILIIIYFLIIFIFAWIKFKLSWDIFLKEFFYFILISFVNSFLFFLPLYLIYQFVSVKELSNFQSICLVVIFGISLVFLNAFTFLKKDFFWYLGVAFITFLLIVGVFQEFNFIPSRVMEIYKFGNIKASSLVLDKKGCQILETLGYKHQIKNDMCIVKNVTILSRLGKEYYLEISKDNNKKNVMKFPIPSSTVLSWVSEKP